MNKVKKSLSRVWFLTQCFKSNVIPKTMRYEARPSNTFSEEGCWDWHNVQHQKSMELIEVAVTEEKILLLTHREKLNLSEKKLIELGAGDVGLLGVITDKLEARGRSI